MNYVQYIFAVIVYLAIVMLVPIIMIGGIRLYKIHQLKKLLNFDSNLHKAEILAECLQLNKFDLKQAIRGKFKESVKADSADQVHFQNIYEEIKRREPFEALSPDLRLHLNNIKVELGNKGFILDPLVNSLQEYSIGKRRREFVYAAITVLSFFIGIVGSWSTLVEIFK